MVVDLGGGTADITIHEKMKDGTLKELYKATGGSWGGIEVDKAYEEMLTNFVGVGAMEKFKREHVGDYFDLLREFETKKRTITTDTTGKMTFRIPAALKECAESEEMTMENLIEKSKYRGKMKWASDKIRVEKVIAKSMFNKAIGKLVNHVGCLLSEPNVSTIDAILLVGGFGECDLVKEAFGAAFPNKSLVIPADAGMAVLKGSVRFGHLPEIVSTRVARYTYGKSVTKPFDERYHDKAKRDSFYGKERCKDVFAVMVKIGEEIPCGREVQENGKPVSVQQTKATINIYSSVNEHPKYVTDEGCMLLGKIKVDLPESEDIDDIHCLSKFWKY